MKAIEWKAETISAIKTDVLQLIEGSRYQKKKKKKREKTSVGDVRITTHKSLSPAS